MIGSSRSSAPAFCDADNIAGDADHGKSPPAQIVGDEAADQAGGAKHEDLSRSAVMLA